METKEPLLGTQFVLLRKKDGSEVVVFGERANPKEMERAAWEDFRGRRRSPADA